MLCIRQHTKILNRLLNLMTTETQGQIQVFLEPEAYIIWRWEIILRIQY